MTVSFVGAGPGAADLVTLRGAQRLARTDVVVWASSLVPSALLEHCQPGVEVHDSAAMTLEDVLEVYASRPAARIVRLHSGDPSLYGAIAEQIDWCRRQGRPFEVVPGVTSISAAAAVLGCELTAPQRGQALVCTRLPGRTGTSMRPGEDVAALSRIGTTMAVLLSGARPDELQADLLGPGSAYTNDTPAAVVVRASWPDEQVVRTTVGGLASTIKSTGATMTLLVLVGDAVADEPAAARSHLYSPEFTTAYRLRSRPGTTVGRPSSRTTEAAAERERGA